jgi:hypothetical protein
MGKALKTIDTSEYMVALGEGSDMVEALEANLLPGETIDIPDLIRIPCPSGGGLTWQWEESGNDMTSKTIDGILVCFQARGVLWPTLDPGDHPPLLVSTDLETAELVGDFYGDINQAELEDYKIEGNTYKWRELPWNQWKSGKDGIGKRCKEQRLLFILRKGDTWPCIVVAPPGSLRDVVRFIKQLKVPHWRAIVSLSLVKEKSKGGIDYAKIAPSLKAELTRDEGQLVKAAYTDNLKTAGSKIAVDQVGQPDSEDFD